MTKRHERLLFRYTSALERGDFDTVAAVLREAERDPRLEQMIVEVNAVYSAQLPTAGQTNHVNRQEKSMFAAQYTHSARQRSSRLYAWILSAAALVLVLLTAVLLSTRLPDNDIGSPQNGAPNAALNMAGSPLCTARTLEDVEVWSRPERQGVNLGQVSAGTDVAVYDLLDTTDGRVSARRSAYIVTAGAQGWVDAGKLDISACPPPQVSGRDDLAATATVMIITATAAAGGELPTLVPDQAQPTTVPFMGQPTIVPDEAQAIQPMNWESPVSICLVALTQPASLYANASLTAPVSAMLAAGTTVVVTLGSEWYGVTELRPDGSFSASGFVLAGTLYLPVDQCETISSSGVTALPPTVIPPAVSASTVIPPTVVPLPTATATPMPAF